VNVVDATIPAAPYQHSNNGSYTAQIKYHGYRKEPSPYQQGLEVKFAIISVLNVFEV